MKKKLFNKWIEALESGDYKQGKGYLKDKYNYYCCLGVLCEVASKELNIHNHLNVETYVYEYKGNSDQNKYQNKLALYELNDTGYSFKEIAQILKESHEEYLIIED